MTFYFDSACTSAMQGESGKLYVNMKNTDPTSGQLFRWTGSTYVNISDINQEIADDYMSLKPSIVAVKNTFESMSASISSTVDAFSAISGQLSGDLISGSNDYLLFKIPSLTIDQYDTYYNLAVTFSADDDFSINNLEHPILTVMTNTAASTLFKIGNAAESGFVNYRLPGIFYQNANDVLRLSLSSILSGENANLTNFMYQWIASNESDPTETTRSNVGFGSTKGVPQLDLNNSAIAELQDAVYNLQQIVGGNGGGGGGGTGLHVVTNVTGNTVNLVSNTWYVKLNSSDNSALLLLPTSNCNDGDLIKITDGILGNVDILSGSNLYGFEDNGIYSNISGFYYIDVPVTLTLAYSSSYQNGSWNIVEVNHL